MSIIGCLPNGKVAFRSQNLAGLIRYGRKHGITLCELGDCTSGDGLYKVTFGNGATCKGRFASPSVMLGFFLGRGFVAEIDCDRHVFNGGAAMGRITLPFLCDMTASKDPLRVGPWLATAYRDAHGTALVRFVRG